MHLLTTTALAAWIVVAMQTPNLRAGLVLSIDSSGSTSIRNNGPTAIDFDGYTIHCELASGDGCAEPTTWSSLEDQIAADAVAVLGRLGAGGLGFAEASPTDKQLSEITLGSGGVLQPNEEISLGQPFESGLDYASAIANNELRWEWTSATLGTTSNAPVSAVPEPSAGLCLAFALMCFCGRRYVANLLPREKR